LRAYCRQVGRPLPTTDDAPPTRHAAAIEQREGSIGIGGEAEARGREGKAGRCRALAVRMPYWTEF
jgi:hypothetical protein